MTLRDQVKLDKNYYEFVTGRGGLSRSPAAAKTPATAIADFTGGIQINDANSLCSNSSSSNETDSAKLA